MMTTQLASRPEAPAAAVGDEFEEFEVLLVAEDLEPGYGVFCLALPGCNSQGDDREHALAMITEAIEGFLEFSSRPEKRERYDKAAVAREWESVGCKVESAAVWVQRKCRR